MLELLRESPNSLVALTRPPGMPERWTSVGSAAVFTHSWTRVPARPARISSRHHATVSESVCSSGISGSQPVAACSRCVRAAHLHHLVRAHALGIDDVVDSDARHAAQRCEQLARPSAEPPEQTL